jgi:predicted TIM-barrel fold metal-dependent hydrolase
VAAHIAENSENLENVTAMLEANPNVFVDISARTSELGRQPYSAHRFFLRFADRILFGSDLVPDVDMYRLYYRFLETEDEYFEYPSHASRQGRWHIYGVNLPDEVLRKVYRDNALKLLTPFGTACRLTIPSNAGGAIVVRHLQRRSSGRAACAIRK